ILARAFRARRLEAGAAATGLIDLQPQARQFLRRAGASMDTSARGMDRVVRVARSIADLDASEEIGEQHLAEALQYRRPVWGAQ
ncbi:MAG TPA: hypothetical protein VHI31_03665, partial [Actinomycetota bacterium]|nr:hypothetical protein [Actinomycetota bacterium]